MGWVDVPSSGGEPPSGRGMLGVLGLLLALGLGFIAYLQLTGRG